MRQLGEAAIAALEERPAADGGKASRRLRVDESFEAGEDRRDRGARPDEEARDPDLEDALLQRLHAGNMKLVFAIFAAIGNTGPTAAWTSAPLVKRIERPLDQGFKDFNGMVIGQAS